MVSRWTPSEYGESSDSAISVSSRVGSSEWSTGSGMVSGVDVDTGGVETGSSGVGVEAESDEGVVTCEVEAGSSGATIEVDDAALNEDEFVNACSLNVGMAVVVACGVDAWVRTGTVEILRTAEGLALYAFHLLW